MPYHPTVTAAIAVLRTRASAVVQTLETAHPHLLTALVSTRITTAARDHALQLIQVQSDIVAAKRHLGVMPWLETAFAYEAMGPAFKGCETSPAFNDEICVAMPAGMDVFEQAACLLIVTDAILRATEKAALILADAHRQAYELTPEVIALICYMLWASENPTVPLAGLMRAEVHHGVTLGEVAADTLAAMRFAVGYLLDGYDGPRTVLPPHRHHAFEVAQVTQAAEACALAREFGDEAFDVCAAGHLGQDAWTLVVREASGNAVGVARIDLLGQKLHVGRVVARGSEGHYSATIWMQTARQSG